MSHDSLLQALIVAVAIVFNSIQYHTVTYSRVDIKLCSYTDSVHILMGRKLEIMSPMQFEIFHYTCSIFPFK